MVCAGASTARSNKCRNSYSCGAKFLSTTNATNGEQSESVASASFTIAVDCASYRKWANSQHCATYNCRSTTCDTQPPTSSDSAATNCDSRASSTYCWRYIQCITTEPVCYAASVITTNYFSFASCEFFTERGILTKPIFFNKFKYKQCRWMRYICSKGDH